jgi:glycosyltransferase involved in cell wall biosynthesis
MRAGLSKADRPGGPPLQSLASFRNLHQGETILVCGCGASLNQLSHPERFITIGVNDVGKLFDPTYLVVLNPRSQFAPERFHHIQTSRARRLFTQLDLGVPHSNVVRFQLGKYGGVDFSNPHVLHYTRNSPYVAVCLAVHLGAGRIGLIGVDLTEHHFFGKTGAHPLSKHIHQIDKEYAALFQAARFKGIELFNLSRESRLVALPKMSLDEFSKGLSRPSTFPRTQFNSANGMENSKQQTKGPARPVSVVAVQKTASGIVGDFLDNLADTARDLGYQVMRDPGQFSGSRDVLSIVWNGRRHRSAGPVLYCEHAWLPRWDYQISSKGINADSHLAPFVWDGMPLTIAQRQALERHLDNLRAGAPCQIDYLRPDLQEAASLPEEFFLAPLQMEWDTNIQRHVPKQFCRMQAFVDFVEAANPPLPILFKQHPADTRRGHQHLRLRLSRRRDRILPHSQGNIHQILKSGRCRGIIALNSNVVHDGIIWHVPAIVLGKNLWPRDGVSPFFTRLPKDWREFEKHATDPVTQACLSAYAYWLMTNQWKLEDSRNLEKVEALIQDTIQRGSSATSIRPIASLPPGPAAHRLINVVGQNRGWLFEDLKAHFCSVKHTGLKVVASERPLREADSWIYFRPQEVAHSPDLRRTVVQIHDLFDEGLYRPGKRRHAVARCAAIVFAHPKQRAILERSGISLDRKRTLVRPLGFLSPFSLRSRLPAVFTIGWVGRPVVHRGIEIKGLQGFIDAIVALPVPRRSFKVVLLGERMDQQHRQLVQHGIQAEYCNRAQHTYSEYPRVYQGFDCLVITSREAAGPMCLFEALATGIPVVSTPVGWSPQLISNGRTGFLVENLEQIPSAVERIYRSRTEWFSRRQTIRHTTAEYTLESWLHENLDLAASLGSADAGRETSRGENQSRLGRLWDGTFAGVENLLRPDSHGRIAR